MLRLFKLLTQKSTPIKLVLLGLVILTSAVAPLLSSPSAHAAGGVTYATQSDLKIKTASVKYYYALLECAGDFHTDINGDDIENPVNWLGNNNVHSLWLGKIFDEWDDHDGKTTCKGDPDGANWLSAALELFVGEGSGAGGQATLEKLGYSCPTRNNEVQCNNPNANKTGKITSGSKSVLGSIQSLDYLKGSNLLSGGAAGSGLQSPDKGAMTYWQAMRALELDSACGGKKGGLKNIVPVSVISATTGKIGSENWGLSVGTDTGQSGSYTDITAVTNNGGESCGTIAKLTVKYAADYQKFTATVVCSQLTGVSAGQSVYFIPGCITGYSDRLNSAACYPKQFNGNATINTYMRNACFRGQNQGTDKDLNAAGTLCVSGLTGILATVSSGAGGSIVDACIRGTQNWQNPTFCTATYPIVGNSNAGGTAADPNQPKQAACLIGQQLGGLIVNAGEVVPFNDGLGQTNEIDGATTCVVDGVGWIVCPLMNAIGGVADAMYNWIESILLLNPLEMTDSGGNTTPMYLTWQRIRDISNVLLVIAFLVIIFSQVTSIGVTNYGVKKLLPRVILVAILVNASFLLMMIAIDGVNLIGKSLYEILIGLAPDVTGNSINGANAFGSLIGGFLTGAVAAGSVVIAALVLDPGVLVLLAVPFIVVAALALLAAIATLFIRNALVVILILIAPLAFAAFLLPNTKSLFDRWRKLIVGVLFLYPTAALLFGGAKFAAYTLAQDGQPLSSLIGIFVMAAPLGLLPWLAASSGGILGSIGGRLQGFAKLAKSPLQGVLKSRVDERKAAYQSGRRTFFNRTRDDAEVRRRAEDPNTRRNIGERLAQAKSVRATSAETSGSTLAQNINDRRFRDPALASRRDQRYARTLDSKDLAGLRTTGNEKAAQERLKQRVTADTGGNLEAHYALRGADADAGSKYQDDRLRARLGQRIEVSQRNPGRSIKSRSSGVDLAQLSKDSYAVEEEVKATEGQVLTINQESGVGDAAIQKQKAQGQRQERVAAKQQEKFDSRVATDANLRDISLDTSVSKLRSEKWNAQNQRNIDRNIADDPTLRRVVLDTEKAKLAGEVAKGEVAVKVAQAKGVGGEMVMDEVTRQALEKKANVSAERLKQMILEGGTNSKANYLNFLGTENRKSLQTSARKMQIIGDATTGAQDVLQQDYASALIADPRVAVAAGGIQPGGEARVVARAGAVVDEARDKAVTAQAQLFKRARYTTDQMYTAATTGMIPARTNPDTGLPEPARPIDQEQREAAMKHIFTDGPVSQQMGFLDSFANGVYNTVNPDGTVSPMLDAAGQQMPVPPRILQALSDNVKASKITSVGGSRHNELGVGSGIPPFAELARERITNGRVDKEVLGKMDLDEFKRFADLAEGKPPIGLSGIPQEQQETLHTAIQKALIDPNINEHFDAAKRAEMARIMAKLPPVPKVTKP